MVEGIVKNHKKKNKIPFILNFKNISKLIDTIYYTDNMNLLNIRKLSQTDACCGLVHVSINLIYQEETAVFIPQLNYFCERSIHLKRWARRAPRHSLRALTYPRCQFCSYLAYHMSVVLIYLVHSEHFLELTVNL